MSKKIYKFIKQMESYVQISQKGETKEIGRISNSSLAYNVFLGHPTTPIYNARHGLYVSADNSFNGKKYQFYICSDSFVRMGIFLIHN
jgi:hypothetical protein